jgi:hypothetical protein
MTNLNKKKYIFHQILIGILILFLIELILGGSGNIICIHNVSIRKILFIFTFCSTFLYIIFFAKKIIIKKLDWFLLIFIIINIFWMTIIPLLKNTGLFTAINDGDTILFLFLYYPIIFLIRQKEINWEKTKKLFIFLSIILAIWHIAMYTIESINPGVYLNYFNTFLPKITFGLYGGYSPVLGYGFVRIITTTSIYLIVAFFYVLGIEQKKAKEFIYIFILIFAIMTTMTRSLLISAIIGLLLYLVPIHPSLCNKDWLKKFINVSIIIIFVLSLNYLYINPMSKQYVENVHGKQEEAANNENIIISESETAIINETVDTDENVVTRIESSTSNTEIGNSIRTQQTKILFDKWKESPWIGYGYGSYTEECIRNVTYKFMYEATVPAMFMKLGILGFSAWIMLIIVMVYFAYKNKYLTKHYNQFLIWFITSITFSLSIQTNPFLFTFCGISIILFLCLDINVINQKNGEVFYNE